MKLFRLSERPNLGIVQLQASKRPDCQMQCPTLKEVEILPDTVVLTLEELWPLLPTLPDEFPFAPDALVKLRAIEQYVWQPDKGIIPAMINDMITFQLEIVPHTAWKKSNVTWQVNLGMKPAVAAMTPPLKQPYQIRLAELNTWRVVLI